jgi:hypothetical protein
MWISHRRSVIPGLCDRWMEWALRYSDVCAAQKKLRGGERRDCGRLGLDLRARATRRVRRGRCGRCSTGLRLGTTC